jgi:hypothetical protein
MHFGRHLHLDKKIPNEKPDFNICFSFFLTFSFGQNISIKLMVDSLEFVKQDTLDCNADLYWRIVAQGGKATPFLIDKLNDTTQTNISFHCRQTKLNVGEISYFALRQIGDSPAFVITHIQFAEFNDSGCWTFFEYFFKNANKHIYQQLVKEWFDKNKKKFRVQKISQKKQTNCQKKFRIDTYYSWRE